MPQVHNKSIAMESSIFGKTSRFMTTVRMSEGSKRRIKAFNTVENRLNRFRLNFYTRHAEIELHKRNREREKIMETIKKRNAYKLVIKNHSLSNCSDYQKALDDRYTAHALRFEIKDMLKFMKPDKIRERNARALVEENRKKYNDVIKKNRETVNTICPKEEWRPKYDYSDDEFELDSDSDDEDENQKKGQSNLSPAKPVLSLQRQGVTKAFVLQSGRTEVDIKLKMSDVKKETKPEYELPPIVVKKQMDPSLQLHA